MHIDMLKDALKEARHPSPEVEAMVKALEKIKDIPQCCKQRTLCIDCFVTVSRAALAPPQDKPVCKEVDDAKSS